MSVVNRIIILALLLTAGLTGQLALNAHLNSVDHLPARKLQKPLADLPMQLSGWQGQDLPIDEPLLYADDHLYRSYVDPEGQQQVVVWIVYSGQGEDRRHHPEVCMAVAGKPEDRSVRQTLPVEGHPEPVQQYRFGSIGEGQWVFYWHYTLPSANIGQLSRVQEVHRQAALGDASLTLEVFASDTQAADTAEKVREFVAVLDAEIQACVGPNARRGSQRKPITIVDTPPS